MTAYFGAGELAESEGFYETKYKNASVTYTVTGSAIITVVFTN